MPSLELATDSRSSKEPYTATTCIVDKAQAYILHYLLIGLTKVGQPHTTSTTKERILLEMRGWNAANQQNLAYLSISRRSVDKKCDSSHGEQILTKQ